jgi:hypothetical protein
MSTKVPQQRYGSSIVASPDDIEPEPEDLVTISPKTKEKKSITKGYHQASQSSVNKNSN